MKDLFLPKTHVGTSILMLQVGAEWVTKGQSVAQANNSVAGIARAIFERQFRYLVSKCNETLVDPAMRR